MKAGEHIPPKSIKLRVVIIASGRAYQEAAAWAAPTYVRQLDDPAAVSVLLPAREHRAKLLLAHAKKYGFNIRRFPFRLVSKRKFTSQLKCQGFWFAVTQAAPDELLLLADADTCCLKPLALAAEIAAAVLQGKIGLVPDIRDRHFKLPSRPWYLAPGERTAYVNSGVILASRNSARLFKVFLRLSRQPRFLHGPFNDQKVINYALGKYFRDQLVLLDRVYNGMRPYRSPATIIAHCAGGAGRLGASQRNRKDFHQNMCFEALRKPHEQPGILSRASAT